MGSLKLWSLVAIALVTWIPFISGGPSSKNAIKLVKPPIKIGLEKNPMPAASKRSGTAVSLEDDENFSGPTQQRPNFGPFPQGFIQGAPPRYDFGSVQDEAQDRYDIEEAPQGGEGGMGFMPEFGPPKGFPDLSKLTGGEFPRMGAPSSAASNYESTQPQYLTYPQESPKYNAFPFPTQGALQYFEDNDDGPSPVSEGNRYQSNPSPTPGSPQGAPKRRPYRSGRPGYRGGNPTSFSNHGPGPNLGGPGPYGSPEGPYGAHHGGPGGSFGNGPSGLDGPSSGRPFGASGRPSRPHFSGRPDGPSSRPGYFGSGLDGPSSGSGLFGSDGPNSRPNPFIGSSDGPPSRPGVFGGNSEGRPPIFGASSGDGPSSRPGLFGPGSNFDGPSDGPYDAPDGPPRPSNLPTHDGPSRPNSFLNIGGAPTRPFGGPSSRPGPYGGPEASSGRPGGHYGGHEGNNGRPEGPNPFGGPEASTGRPGSHGPFGGPSEGSSGRPGSHSPFGGPSEGSGGRPGSHGPYGGPDHSHGRPGGSFGGRSDAPPAYSFQNTAPNPGFRLSRGYPRYHPNQIQNDDFKESADNGDFSPFGNGPQFNYASPPPRHLPAFRPDRPDDYEQSPYQSEGPRPRRPEFSPQPQQLGSMFGSTHRNDVKRPIVLKVSGLKTKYSRDLPPGPPVFYAPSPDMKTKDNSRKFQDSEDKENMPAEASNRAKSYLVKSRPKRDLEEHASPCKTGKERGCSSFSRERKTLQRRISNVQRTSSGAHQSRKSAKKSKNTNRTKSNSRQDPLIADGTQQQGFWEVSPQPSYGSYNTNYKKQSAPVLTAQERQDEYEIEDDDESLAPPSAPARSTSRNNQTFADTTSDEQRFFPSFPAPPSPYLSPFTSNGGFARPPLFPGPTANRAPSRFHPQFGPKYTAPPPNRGPSSAYPAESHDRYLHTNLLGSGNFEVVRGGTYYGDDGDDAYHHATGTGGGHYHQEDDDGYFHHNGHSSPHGYRNNPGDFFANFRDFADINPTRSFSHHMETVADAEPHGSATSHEQPKNILDKLESSSDKVEVHQPYTGRGSSSSYGSRDSDPMMATF